MPHVLDPLIAPAIRATGANSSLSSTTQHRIRATGPAVWRAELFRDPKHADAVVTLSNHVSSALLAQSVIESVQGAHAVSSEPRLRKHREAGSAGEGRALPLAVSRPNPPYKGLDLLIDAVEILRGRGYAVELGVFGEGMLGKNQRRLEALGAEVRNEWLGSAEISATVGRYHAIALSHIEASQSGIAAVAAGHGIPVVANPVGGLVEQVEDGCSGVVASVATAPAFATAVARLINDSALYNSIVDHLASAGEPRSMRAFLGALLQLSCVRQGRTASFRSIRQMRWTGVRPAGVVANYKDVIECSRR